MNWLFYSLSENLAWSRMGVWQRSSVVVLLIMVLYASIGFAVKARLLRRARISSRDFAPAAASALREGKIEEAIEVSRTFEKGGSHLAGLVLVALEEVMQGRSSGTPNSTIMVIVREKMEQDASKRSFEWKSGLGPLDAIGRTSPFVGAAVGTPFGLFVGTLLAVAALWFCTYFRTNTERIDVELKHVASEIREYLTKWS